VWRRAAWRRNELYGSGRLVEPEDVASLVAFLAALRTVSMTGHEYIVDGGAIKTI
jgi:putative oxidoreductase